ncbi:CFEM domain-containing protein [Sarocladium strictum]
MYFESIIGHVLDARQAGPAEVPTRPENWEYPYSALQHGGFAILFTFPALALITVVLRVYSRLSTRQFGLDDAFIVAAMLDSLAETAVSYIFMRKNFIGVHGVDIPPWFDRQEALRWNYMVQALYNPILALVKTSVLLFLLRISGQNKRVRMYIHALNAFNIALMIAIFFVVIFQCTPVSLAWEIAGPNPPEGTCINGPVFITLTAALTILTDILVLVLPFWIFLGLQMPRRVKWALLGVFALGGVVTIISILRMHALIERFFVPPKPDANYDIRFVYSAVETNIAILAASAPALRGLFAKWFPKLFSSLTSGGRATYGEDGTGKRSRSGTNGLNNQHHVGSRHTETFQMKNMKNRSEIRSHSPSASEEEIMTYNGIIRTTEVDVMYSDGSSENHHALDKDDLERITVKE